MRQWRSKTPDLEGRSRDCLITQTEKKKKRKTISVRRFKVSPDGTRVLISMTTGLSTTKASQMPS